MDSDSLLFGFCVAFLMILSINHSFNLIFPSPSPLMLDVILTNTLFSHYQILEEYHYHEYTSDKLYNALGIDTNSSSSSKTAASNKAKPMPKTISSVKGDNGLITGYNRLGKFQPWSVTNFDKGSCQWRLLVLAHYLMDVHVSPGMPQYGADCCITYSLGTHT